jgi:DNA-binding SARP family transcriptional activator
MCPRADIRGVVRQETMRVRLLGSFEVSVGSQTIGRDAWRLTKAASLVKLLALAPGHRLHREQAMDVLWPDSAARAASNSLRQTLHAVRRVLDPAVGSHYLTSEDGQLSLCPEDNCGWTRTPLRTLRRSRDAPETRRLTEWP